MTAPTRTNLHAKTACRDTLADGGSVLWTLRGVGEDGAAYSGDNRKVSANHVTHPRPTPECPTLYARIWRLRADRNNPQNSIVSASKELFEKFGPVALQSATVDCAFLGQLTGGIRGRNLDE